MPQVTLLPATPVYGTTGQAFGQAFGQIGEGLRHIGESIKQARAEKKAKEEQSFQMGLTLALQGIPVDYDALGKQAERLYDIKFEKRPEMTKAEEVPTGTRGLSTELPSVPTGREIHPLEAFAQQAQEQRMLQSALTRNQAKIAELTSKALGGDQAAQDLLTKTGFMKPDMQTMLYSSLSSEERKQFLGATMLGEKTSAQKGEDVRALALKWLEEGRVTTPEEAREAASAFTEGRQGPPLRRSMAQSVQESIAAQRLIEMGLPARVAFKGAEDLVEGKSLADTFKNLPRGFKTAVEQQIGMAAEGLGLKRAELGLEGIKLDWLMTRGEAEDIRGLLEIEEKATTVKQKQALDALRDLAVLKKAGVDTTAIEEQATTVLAESFGMEKRKVFTTWQRIWPRLISLYTGPEFLGLEPAGVQLVPGAAVREEVTAAVQGQPTREQTVVGSLQERYKRLKARLDKLRGVRQ